MVVPVSGNLSKTALDGVKDLEKQSEEKTQAKSEDVARFKNAMQSNAAATGQNPAAVEGRAAPQGVQQSGQVQQNPQASAQQAQGLHPGQKVDAPGKTDADSILGKVSQLSKNWSTEGNNVMHELDKPEMSDADLLKAQFQLSQLSVDKQVTSESASKATKGIKTLFRGQ